MNMSIDTEALKGVGENLISILSNMVGYVEDIKDLKIESWKGTIKDNCFKSLNNYSGAFIDDLENYKDFIKNYIVSVVSGIDYSETEAITALYEDLEG